MYFWICEVINSKFGIFETFLNYQLSDNYGASRSYPQIYGVQNVKHVDVNEVDVQNQFTNGQEFEVHDHMF